MNQVLRQSLRKINSCLLLTFLLLISNNAAHAQSLSVFDVDQSAFPTIKAKFYAFDKDGKQITNLSPADFQVKEDGVERNVTFVSCPEPKPPVALSSVLVFDVSGSMRDGPPRIQSAKDAANAWVDELSNNSECALVSFSDKSSILHDFTRDKKNLKTLIEKLTPSGGTNYNQALIDAPAGGLQVASKGKYKRVVVFMSDGLSNFGTRTQDIMDFAIKNNITVYCVILDMNAPDFIKEIAQNTGGACFENIKTRQEAEEIYKTIMKLAQNNNSCSLNWESASVCDAGNIHVELSWNGIKRYLNYMQASGQMADIQFNPFSVYINKKPVGVPFDTTIMIKAVNYDFKVTDIISNNPAFDVTPKKFTLLAGHSRILKIRFTPLDSNFTISKFDIINDVCPKAFYVAGNIQGKKIQTGSFRLLHPNGGEMFAAGSDTVITWEGTMPNDTVSIYFSNDNGASWKLLTDKATGFSYKWRNIPKPPSGNCLIKISVNNEDNKGQPDIPSIQWQKCLGGSEQDVSFSITGTIDGGYLITGSSKSTNKDVLDNHGQFDFWIVKLNQSGQIQSKKCFGGKYDEIAYSTTMTKDGGFIVAGDSHSNDGDVKGNHGNGDVWILKLDENGSIQWQKCIGGSYTDNAQSIIETIDGGFIIAGNTPSNDGDISGKHDSTDCWIVKLNQSGDIQWQKCLGGSHLENAQSIVETKDGGFIIGGWTTSNDGDVSGNHGAYDSWIVKLSQAGDIQWQKCLGGSENDYTRSIIETSDGGFIAAGYTLSNDGDVSGNKFADAWIVKMYPTGEVQWQKCLGGSAVDGAYSVIETKDGGFIVAGYTWSNNGDVSGNHGRNDCWIVKLDQTGNIQWQKCLGGSGSDNFYSIIEASDGGYIAAGETFSNDGDISGFNGYTDIWVVKLGPESLLLRDVSDSVFSIVLPQPSAQDIDLKQCLVGSIKDSLVTGFISNTGTYKCSIDSIYFTGADASAFSLVSGIPHYEITPNGSHSVEFRFKPGRVGIHQAQVVIITQADTLVQNIRGEGVQPLISIVDDFIDFGAVSIGEFKDTLQALTIKNVGTNPVDIISTKHVFPNDKDFTTLKGAGPFTLQPGETAKMDLRYTPTEIGRTNGCLEFNFNGPGSPAVVRLFGQGLGGAVIVSSDSAYAGEKRKLKLSLGNSIKPKAESLITKFKAKFSYNKTMLTMTEPGAIKSFDNYYETSEVTSDWDGSSSTLGEFEVMAGLGNSDTTDLIIDEFSWLNDIGEPVDFETETTNGKFILLGVCREGGTRLLHPEGHELIKDIYPNPSGGEIVINFELSEKSYSRIYITNILGKKVKDVYSNNNPELGEQSISINISDISSGTYYIILETMNGCQGKRIEVVR